MARHFVARNPAVLSSKERVEQKRRDARKERRRELFEKTASATGKSLQGAGLFAIGSAILAGRAIRAWGRYAFKTKPGLSRWEKFKSGSRRGILVTGATVLALHAAAGLPKAGFDLASHAQSHKQFPPAKIWQATGSELAQGTVQRLEKTGGFIYRTASGGYLLIRGEGKTTSPAAKEKPVSRAPSSPFVATPASVVQERSASSGDFEFSGKEQESIRRYLIREKKGNKANPRHLDLLEREAKRAGIPVVLSEVIVDHESDWNQGIFNVNSNGFSRVKRNGTFFVRAPDGNLHSLEKLLQNPNFSRVDLDIGLGQVNRGWSAKYPDLLSAGGNLRAHAEILKSATFAEVNGRQANILDLNLPVETKLAMIGARYNGGPVSFKVPIGKSVSPSQITFFKRGRLVPSALREHFLRYGKNVRDNLKAYEKAAGRL